MYKKRRLFKDFLLKGSLLLVFQWEVSL